MSATGIKALPALGTLAQSACRVNRHRNKLRFRFRRSALDALPGCKELQALGVPFRVKTGGQIHCFDGDKWSQIATTKVRAWTTVEVTVS